MQVHEVVYDATLQIVLNAVDDDLLPNVHNFEIGIVAFVAVAVNGLVYFFVLADSFAEIAGGILRILALVVGAASLDIENVCHNDIFLIAFTLDEEDPDAVGLADIVDPFAAVFCRVGGVKNANDAAGAEPAQHVGDGCLSGGTAFALALGIIEVEKVGGGMWRVVAPVVADVEGLGRDGQPLKVALG